MKRRGKKFYDQDAIPVEITDNEKQEYKFLMDGYVN